MTLRGRKTTYCQKWNSLMRAPMRPMSERAAKKQDSAGCPYTVLLGDNKNPDAIVEVNWGNNHVGVWFLDEQRRRRLRYGFTRIDTTAMFMNNVTVWSYPEETDPDIGDLKTASTVTSFDYQADGIVRETVQDFVQGIDEIIDRSDVALDINWEPVPTFGEWDSVARYNREPAQQGN